MKGIVKSTKKDKTAIKIEEKWYYLKGDALTKHLTDDIYGYEIDYVLEPESTDRIIFYNKLDKKSYPKAQINARVEKTKAKDVDWDGKDRRMVRMNCLTQANTMINTIMNKENNITSDKIESLILNHAERFEAWIYRESNTQPGVETQKSNHTMKTPTTPNSNVEGGGSSPLSSPFKPSEQESEDWITYKSLKGEEFKIKAFYVEFALSIGYDDKRINYLWDGFTK